MIHVSAPTRLHFGLLHVATDADPTARRFGGCGLMLAAPRVTVSVSKSDDWGATGPVADRALAFARRVVAGLPAQCQQPVTVAVEACPPEHAGLGVGTALGLAVARAVATEVGAGPYTTTELALLAGRGERSAVGVHGSALGGFIIDGGKAGDDPVGACVGRLTFPDWPVVLIQTSAAARWHGAAERQAFGRPRPAADAARLTDRMCRLLMLGVAPAVATADYPRFADALFEYNRAAGEPFAADQGGIYASEEIEAVIDAARAAGVPAAGQSSWGPTAFAICPDAATAARLAAQLRGRFPEAGVVVSRSYRPDQPNEDHIGRQD